MVKIINILSKKYDEKQLSEIMNSLAENKPVVLDNSDISVEIIDVDKMTVFRSKPRWFRWLL